MSQTDSQTITIEDHTFEVSKLDPFTAQDILVELGQTIGPALSKAVAGLGKLVGEKTDIDSLLDADVADPDIANAVGALFATLDKAMLRNLVKTMAEVTVYVGSEKRGKLTTVFNPVFRGDLPLMYQWLWFALTVNFGNFFGWAGNAISGIAGIVKAAQSQNTSGGTGQR